MERTYRVSGKAARVLLALLVRKESVPSAKEFAILAGLSEKHLAEALEELRSAGLTAHGLTTRSGRWTVKTTEGQPGAKEAVDTGSEPKWMDYVG